MSFVYDDAGMVVGYDCESEYPAEVAAHVEQRMLAWYRGMSGQSRQRIGKRDMLLGNPSPNLKRMENE